MRLADGKPYNLYDVAKLMLLQGCRPEEVMSLKKSNYDATRGELRIEGENRRLPNELFISVVNQLRF